VLSKRLRSKLLTPGIQIALSQQGRGITCKLCPSVAIITCEASSATFAATELWLMRLRHGRKFPFTNKQMGKLRTSALHPKQATCGRGWILFLDEAECLPIVERLDAVCGGWDFRATRGLEINKSSDIGLEMDS
jgi:hypothetical protein